MVPVRIDDAIPVIENLLSKPPIKSFAIPSTSDTPGILAMLPPWKETYLSLSLLATLLIVCEIDVSPGWLERDSEESTDLLILKAKYIYLNKITIFYINVLI